MLVKYFHNPPKGAVYRCSIKKAILEIFLNLIGKHQCRGLSLT